MDYCRVLERQSDAVLHTEIDLRPDYSGLFTAFFLLAETFADVSGYTEHAAATRIGLLLRAKKCPLVLSLV